jgi:hypothetical protein
MHGIVGGCEIIEIHREKHWMITNAEVTASAIESKHLSFGYTMVLTCYFTCTILHYPIKMLAHCGFT